MSRSPVVLVVEAAGDEISAVVGDATGSVLSPEFCERPGEPPAVIAWEPD
jgi:hypothetical protein